MKDPELNPLNQNQRRLLQIGVVILLAIFLALYFFVINKKPTAPAVIINTSVYLQDGRLHVFDETIAEPIFPSKLVMHYPYFLIVKPEQQMTTIYNLNNKKKDKDVGQILLDYDGTNLLYNKGKSTLLNDQDLGVLCQTGWIKSKQDVLCVTQVKSNNVENKLVDIDLITKTQKNIYVSADLITALSFVNNVTYLGEVKLFNNKNYLLIDNKRVEVANVVSMIYQMNSQPYFISLKSALNKIESNYLIGGNIVTKQDENKIYLAH